MIYRIFLGFSLTLVFSYQSFAQVSKNCSLSGKITDLVGNPLPLSKIQVGQI